MSLALSMANAMVCSKLRVSLKRAYRVLDDLPNLLGLLINVIGEVIGMHITVLIGGPEPRKKGQLNMVG